MTLVSKVMSDYPYEKDNDPAVESGDEETDLRYFKLPYVGQYSTLVKQKLKNLVIQNCDKIDARFIFTSHKVGQYFSNKDLIILDKAATKYQLRIKEGMYIKRDTPELNKKVHCYVPSICL